MLSPSRWPMAAAGLGADVQGDRPTSCRGFSWRLCLARAERAAASVPSVGGSAAHRGCLCGTGRGDLEQTPGRRSPVLPAFPEPKGFHFGNVLILNLSPSWTWTRIKEGVLFFLKVLGHIRSAEFQVL